ncbi:ABC transporter ATP-binding protein [Paracraurococcus lichenis]|uniref:ABC transporter ATP-binding protein n=1 Tax=Paracraurococcus lichenis TaxID=3064888 RepID=A0ABT9E2H0_9PROT|nr:ABC transporter ATP-binding protein [Paracraurococcus sp. LOR1-02]MDO9710357.1 ABC transporter ATP-binding protein [Paracraurococcus sp. LOR1-02]
MLHRPPPDAEAALRGHTLDVLGLGVRYGAFTALDDVDLSVRAGEVLALLGPSGCGKTTLLRSVAGFVRQNSGQVLIDGTSIDDLPPNRRRVGIVFQNYALFPHMSVAENVAYGLKARGEARARIAPRVTELLEMVQLGPMRDRLPRQLSGGQQQRVALARALAIEPSILLLDEPFAALDRSLRLDMQIEIKRLQRQLGLTAILVTHDQDEAMSVADRIAVMRRGRIEQLGTPVDVYERPETLFVAGFIGTTNRLPCTVEGTADGMATVRLPDGTALAVPAEAPPGPALLTVRPEQLVLRDEAGPDAFPVELGLALPLGGQTIREARLPDGTPLRLTEPRLGAIRDLGGRAFCALAPGARPALFPKPPSEED